MRHIAGIIRGRIIALTLAGRFDRSMALRSLLSAAVVIALALLAVAVLLSLASCGGGSAMPSAGGDPGLDQQPATGDNPAGGGAGNTGAGMDTGGDSGSALPRATSADFTLTVQNDTYQVTDHVDDITMTVDDQGDTVVVQAKIFGAVEMYAFVATLDFDPVRFDPVSLRLADMERPELGLQEPNKLPGAKEYGRYWLIENRT